jgi:hypothetical protein
VCEKLTNPRDSSGFSHGPSTTELYIANYPRRMRCRDYRQHYPCVLLARQSLRNSYVTLRIEARFRVSNDTALLIQSLLLILSQLLLLALCLHYAPHNRQDEDFNPMTTHHSREESAYLSTPPQSKATRIKNMLKNRPFDFWQWEGYGNYIEFLAGMIVVLGILQVIFGRWMW